MSNRFVGHVSLKSFGTERSVVVQSAKEVVLAFVAEGAFRSVVFVYEEGAEHGGPHAHYYVESSKSEATLRRLFAKHFRKGAEGQWMSLKKFDPSKESRYFLYLAKGVTSGPDDDVIVLWDDGRRMWPELHVKYHENAHNFRASKTKRVGEWYEALAEECRRTGKKSKADVVARVCEYYVRESKKGFDKFAVCRTFWAVYSLVNGDDAQSSIVESVTRLIE